MHELHPRRNQITLEIEQTDDWDLSGVPARIYFTERPTKDDLAELEEVVVGWHRVGVRGGFEGMVHDAKIRPLVIEDDKPMVLVVLDVGSAPRAALDVFLRALRGLKRIGVPIDRVLLSWREEEEDAVEGD
jgi:hypothetical protein